MKKLSRLSLVLTLTSALLASAQAQTPLETGIKMIAELAQVNGLALACQEPQVASRTKSLMLAHAPKTARFGNAYEEGTQQSYAAQISGVVPCPSRAELLAKLDTLDQQLRIHLPATTPTNATNTPTGAP